jgi:hypothetical protein
VTYASGPLVLLQALLARPNISANASFMSSKGFVRISFK